MQYSGKERVHRALVVNLNKLDLDLIVVYMLKSRYKLVNQDVLDRDNCDLSPHALHYVIVFSFSDLCNKRK